MSSRNGKLRVYKRISLFYHSFSSIYTMSSPPDSLDFDPIEIDTMATQSQLKRRTDSPADGEPNSKKPRLSRSNAFYGADVQGATPFKFPAVKYPSPKFTKFSVIKDTPSVESHLAYNHPQSAGLEAICGVKRVYFITGDWEGVQAFQTSKACDGGYSPSRGYESCKLCSDYFARHRDDLARFFGITPFAPVFGGRGEIKHNKCAGYFRGNVLKTVFPQLPVESPATIVHLIDLSKK